MREGTINGELFLILTTLYQKMLRKSWFLLSIKEPVILCVFYYAGPRGAQCQSERQDEKGTVPIIWCG